MNTPLPQSHYRREVVEWLYLLVAMLVLGSYIAYSLYRDYMDTDDRQRARLTNQAAVVEKNLVPQLFSTSRALDGILESMPTWRRENDGFRKAGQRLKLIGDTLTGIRTLVIIDATGRALASNKDELVGQDLSQRDYFQQALKAPQRNILHVTPPFKTILNSWVMSVYRIVAGPNGEFGGIVIASVNPSYFNTLLDSVRDSPDMWTYLAHGDGALFLMAPERVDLMGKDLFQPGSMFYRHILSGEPNNLLVGASAVTGEANRFTALRTIQPDHLNMDKPLVVAVSRDSMAVFAGWRNELYTQVGIFMALLALTLVSLFFYQQRRRVYLRLAASKEQALRASDARLHSFFAATPDALLISDAQGIITLANQQVERLLGYSVEELMGKSIDKLVPRRYRGNHPSQRSEFAGNPDARRMGNGLAVKARRKDGSECDVEVSLSRIETDDGLFFASALRDITARIQSEEQLRIAAVAFESHQGVAVTDTNDVILRVNAAFTKLTGYSADEAIGQSLDFLRSDRQDAHFWAAVWETIMRDGSWEGEIWNRTKGGEVRPYWLTIASVKNDKHVISHYIETYTDISDRKNTLAALQSSEAWFRGIFENANTGMFSTDKVGKITSFNESFRAMLGFDADALERMNARDFTHPDDLDLNLVFVDEIHARKRENYQIVKRYIAHDQRILWVDISATVIRNAEGLVTNFVGVARDVTANQKAEADLRIAAAAFESQHGLVVTDANSVILRINHAFTEITGYSAEEAIGQTPRLFKSGRHDASYYRSMWDAIQKTDQWAGEIWDRRKNGEVYPKWLTISAVRDAEGDVTHYVGSHQDISDRKKAEEKITALAFFDQLTGLPNRTLLLDRLKQAMTSSGRSGTYGALLFIDLDNFKSLNDTLGHDMGDLLLKQVSQRLTGCVRDGDTVARLGGDEFVVILTSLSVSKTDAASGTETAAEKILATLNQSYRLGGLAHRSTASIGATLFQGQVTTMDDLMKQADMAMYRAKEAGRNAVRFFDPDMETAVLNRVAMEKDLRQAVQEKQFSLHYQALVADAGHVTGAEVLARWHHPERGMVPPAEFIPLAEETGVILSLGHWVLETACTQLALWAARPEMAHLTVAVNVSAHQFRQGDFVDQVLSVLKSTGANPRRLKLELTESFLVSNVEDTIAKMLLLKAQGVGFALDDFGTGYSSLAYLKRLPLNHLKIDRSFVRDVLIDPNDAAIARTIVALARSLGLGVIAEGVETQAQRDFLASSGCHAYQGYLFSRPLTVEGFEAYAFTQDMPELQRSEAVALVTGERAARQG